MVHQVQWLEVIRILGPFPNVRNTLTGRLKASTTTSTNGSLQQLQQLQQSGGGTTKWQIAWESLIDGTGKEIYADQVRKVDLSVVYCDEQIIVVTAATTSKEEEKKDSSANNTSSAMLTVSEAQDILVFVREDDMEDKLVRYRVA